MLITKDRYEGLDPELAKELKKGKIIKGIFSDDGWDEEEGKTVGYLAGYCDAHQHPFKTIHGVGYTHFEPSLKEETLSDVVEIYSRGGSIPKDTKVLCSNVGDIVNRYFKEFSDSIVVVYDSGNTSWSADNIVGYSNAKLETPMTLKELGIN